MATQRIILVNNAQLMHEMLKRVIDKSPGLEIVSEVDELIELPDTLRSTETDWAIVLLDPDEGIPELVEQIISEQTSMRFLLMGVDGSHARMMWNEPHEVPLDEKNLLELLAILRTNQQERMRV
jgi:DNA-binding NarL/FixJ family response regulator